MRVGSLFSGIGGLDLGLKRAGMTVAWQVEIDPFCRRVLEKHWPDVPKYGDIRELKGDELEAVTLIAGGFPCQNVSVAGKRAGLAGEQSRLYFDFIRIVSELAPTWVLIENVPGLLSSNGGRDMGTVLGTLAELGYGYAYRVLDSQYFGVAQRRRRVFIVGCLGDWRSAVQVLFEPESLPGNPPPRRKEGQVSASLLASGAGTSRPAGIASETDFLVSHALTTWPGQRQDPSIVGSLQARDWKGVGNQFIEEGKVIPVLRGFGHDWQGQHNDDMAKVGLVRRLTPLECERLQGFPDGWTAIDGDETPDTPRYRALGNAVTVPVAEWIGRRIMAVEEAKKCNSSTRLMAI